MHEYLTAALAVQDARRDWILTNWPHLIELEQLTALIAEHEPLAHWPTTQQPAVQEALAALRALAPDVDERETRTLAEIDQVERDADPVQQLEARANHLRSLATQATTAEAQAVEAKLTQVTTELRAARRERRLKRTFDRYRTTRWEMARDARIKTITHDTLAGQPEWLIEEHHRLHTNDELTSVTSESLVDHLVSVELDGGGTAVRSRVPGPTPDLGL